MTTHKLIFEGTTVDQVVQLAKGNAELATVIANQLVAQHGAAKIRQFLVGDDTLITKLAESLQADPERFIAFLGVAPAPAKKEVKAKSPTTRKRKASRKKAAKKKVAAVKIKSKAPRRRRSSKNGKTIDIEKVKEKIVNHLQTNPDEGVPRASIIKAVGISTGYKSWFPRAMDDLIQAQTVRRVGDKSMARYWLNTEEASA